MVSVAEMGLKATMGQKVMKQFTPSLQETCSFQLHSRQMADEYWPKTNNSNKMQLKPVIEKEIPINPSSKKDLGLWK